MAAPERYIALFGPRACGKTVFLGALYGSFANSEAPGTDFHVAAADDQTHNALARVYRSLKEGSWPPATAFEELKRMALVFTSGEATHRVIMPDVAGELTTRPTDSEGPDRASRELKEKILDEYKDYHGFLIFSPIEPDPRRDGVEYKWEVDALIQALRERAKDGEKITRPVAVLLSKWDLLDSKESEEAAETRFREANPSLASGLAETCKNFRVFPISATGSLVDGKPPVPLASFNLGAPITWLLKIFDETRRDRLEVTLKEYADKLAKRDNDRPGRPTFFKLSLQSIEDFLRDVPHGDAANWAREEREKLLTWHRGRRAKIGVAIAFTVALTVATVAGSFDRAAYNEAIRLMEGGDTSLSPAKTLATVDGVLTDSRHVVGRTVGWWKDLGSKRKTFHDGYEEARFAEIKDVGSPKDAVTASRLLDLIKKFKSDFPNSARSSGVRELQIAASSVLGSTREEQSYNRIKARYEVFQGDQKNRTVAELLQDECANYLKTTEDGQHVAEVQKIQTEVEVALAGLGQDISIEELKVELSKKAEDPFECHLLCGTFLANNPNHPQAEWVRSQQEEYLKRADESKWSEAVAYAAKYRTRYLDQLVRYNDYLKNAQFVLHRGEANEARKAALRGVDLEAYEKIRKRAMAGNEPEVLLDLQELCRNYLSGDDSVSRKAMKGEVKEWLSWFDSWRDDKGKPFHVEVESVRVDRNSQWHYTWRPWYWWSPSVWVQVSANKSILRTGIKEVNLGQDERELPDKKLGPFRWAWGDPPVQIWMGWDKASPQYFTAQFPGDEFSVRHLNGPIEFNDGKISLRLRCPEAVPPPFPPYRG